MSDKRKYVISVYKGDPLWYGAVYLESGQPVAPAAFGFTRFWTRLSAKRIARDHARKARKKPRNQTIEYWA